MKITTARRISQVFFMAMLLWFAVITTVGVEWWQLRGWPANLLIHLDPLAALATLLTTHTLYAGMILAAATAIGTILLGRFFCSWVCPFGAMHQFFGWLGRGGKNTAGKIAANRYRRAQSVKYFILLAMLAAAVIAPSSLLTGLLDPIPLAYRSVNLVALPAADAHSQKLFAAQRFYEWSWLVGAIFLAAILLNFLIPRFYCRFICPLGALLGILGRWAIFRVGKKQGECQSCGLCEADCEGACEPAGKIRISECVLCMNCLHACRHETIRYQRQKSQTGEITSPDITRRGVILSIVSGLAVPPLMRLGGKSASNWNSSIIRPPGALDEVRFLDRCIRCGQCMRVCPTNVIQPGGFQGGLETLWTPMLNNRVGTSGCQVNCVACGAICPTAAIRRISLDEKQGTGKFASAGPIRLGTAFVDRGRCLPWSMEIPCIVCQENCPVSPKAIDVREQFNTIAGGSAKVAAVSGATIHLAEAKLAPGKYASGDYYCKAGQARSAITANAADSITVVADKNWKAPTVGQTVDIQVRLQQPFVIVENCIGCGICEHECPVSGLRAIRVTAENETRSKKHALLI